MHCNSQESTEAIPNVIDVIHSRKSVRNYTDQIVSRDQLKTLVRAGMAAPTAMNRQPWFFVLVDDKEILNELGDILMFGKMLKDASAAIVVCGDMRRVYSLLPEYWIQDCSAATQNILLAAEGIGLGAVWIGVYPRKRLSRQIQSILNLPRRYVPFNVISIGYPTGEDKPKDKFDEDRFIWNKMD